MKEKKEGDIERTRQQRLGWSLSHSYLNMHEVTTWRAGRNFNEMKNGVIHFVPK